MMTRGQSQLDQTGTDSGPEASARPLHVQLWSYNYDPEPTGIGPVSKVLAEGLRSRATTSRSSPPTRTIPCRGGGSESTPTPALLPAVANARARRLPWLLWLHDILPDGAAATGIVESGFVPRSGAGTSGPRRARWRSRFRA